MFGGEGNDAVPRTDLARSVRWMANVRIRYNRSLKMSPGKIAAQAVHAALAAYGIEHGSVVVLEGTATQVNQMDVQIHDAGLTEVEPGSLTAGASLVPVAGEIVCIECGGIQTHRVCVKCFTV
jgi:PTH2 family peptidyl-tRNA hydrolase